MSRISWQDRVVVDENLHHGEPCIRGTRIAVRTLIGSLADGMKPSEILEVYPQLSEEDLLGALAYAADVMRQELMVPFAPSTPSDALQDR
ncbi:MAG TPA: DUF433 domain-containing protein [Thermoanaerobaculia bacterium]